MIPRPVPQLSSPRIVRELMETGRRARIESGATLFREGDPVTDVFCIAAGNVIVTRHAENGGRQIIAFLFPGDFLGMTFAEAHLTGAEALTNAEVWALPQATLKRGLESRAELGFAFAEMATRIINSEMDVIFTLGRKNARARVASFILYLRGRQELLGRPTDPVQMPMTRQDIADFLGLTMETVSRSFSQLRASGCIAADNPPDVHIADLPALRQAADLAP
jgi:CRP/FNR family transcriptional regulator